MDKTPNITQNKSSMKPKKRIGHIVKWIKQYATKAKISTLVVGVSGGIDSSVVSTLCAMTGLPTIVVSMPIYQVSAQKQLSEDHAAWLTQNYSTVTHINLDLTPVFAAFEQKVGPVCSTDQAPGPQEQLAFANSRARLRMMSLYQIAQCNHGIVVGTGNRVEDFGVGFYTKYGDGGVDISPIGDCLKTDVWAMGREMGLLQEIIDAAPTDGLWNDRRTDEDQLGMTYPELELAMALDTMVWTEKLSKDQARNLQRYRKIRAANLHKMLPIPVCMIDNN